MDTNYDNVYLRDLILGVLGHLRDKIKITQITSDGSEDIDVQFLYSYAVGQEDWYMDFYLDKEGKVCSRDLKDDGNTIKIPSGIISLNGINVNSGASTQKNERAVFQKIESNILGYEVNDYSTRMNFVPIAGDMSVKIKCSSEIQRFKIWEAVLNTFYNHGSFRFMHMGILVPAYIKFPQTYSATDSNTSFKYPGKEKPVLDFSIELTTSFPIEDKQTTRKKSVEGYLVSHSKDAGKVTTK